MFLIPTLLSNEKEILPFLPFFVVTIITPLAPLFPYMASDAASLRTLILSISAVLILFILFVKTPSTTYKGSRPASTVPNPLIITCEAVPGASDAIICTPAAFPCNAWVALIIGSIVKSSPSTELTELVNISFFWLPYPITTTSSNVLTSSSKVIFPKLFNDDNTNSWFLNPT